MDDLTRELLGPPRHTPEPAEPDTPAVIDARRHVLDEALNPRPPLVYLYPTPTRLALLAAVHAGAVVEGITENTEGNTWLTFDDGQEPVRVTARMRQLETAGWVELPDDPPVFWLVTELGLQVLEAGAP